MEKAKFDLAKARLEREARLTIINSKRYLTAQKTYCRNNKEIDETPRKVLALALQFACLPHGEILIIFQNWFWPLNLYKLQYLKGRDDIYRDQTAIEDCII